MSVRLAPRFAPKEQAALVRATISQSRAPSTAFAESHICEPKYCPAPLRVAVRLLHAWSLGRLCVRSKPALVRGDHAKVGQICGIYLGPVPNENAVHSLEHCATWITYRPDLPADQVKVLQDAVKNRPSGLLSPFLGVPAPVVASVWGVQLKLESATDPQLAAFVAKYADGGRAPEPKAGCSTGVGNPQR